MDEETGKVSVTRVVFAGNVGWAIDYSLMIIARSTDHGKTWEIVNTEPLDCMMPWGIKVVSPESVWVWGLYTTETEWVCIPNTILVTQDGGKTWHGLPHLVDWLYNVEVMSSDHAIVIGRVRPDDWPKLNAPEPHKYNDPRTLPLMRFETKDGGKTFRKR